jgi:hypothetical protein
MRKIGLAAIATVLGLAALLVPGTAAARTITVGGELTGPTPDTITFSGPTATIANGELTGPNATVAPVDGRVVRWRVGPQPGTDTYRLTVLHPTGLGTYVATATSDPEPGSNSLSSGFTTALPIQAGDLIGLGISSTEPQVKLLVAPVAGATQFGWGPALGIGSPATAPNLVPGFESQFNAEIAPAPRVSRVAPASGPIAGGTAVIVFGRDFTQVGGVSFGSVPASSFTVLSENEIAATAPAGVRPGPFDVTVTTAIGTSPAEAADTFTYDPAPTPVPAPTPSPTPEPAPTCKVPSLTGKTLPATRQLLRRSRCRLGAVRGHRRTGDKVIKQSPRPGLSRPSGWAVNVTID